jgi:hypothetical protein
MDCGLRVEAIHIYIMLQNIILPVRKSYRLPLIPLIFIEGAYVACYSGN